MQNSIYYYSIAIENVEAEYDSPKTHKSIEIEDPSFVNSWISLENLIMIENENIIKPSHAVISRPIMNYMIDNIPMDASRDDRIIPIILGYRFEWDFIHSCKKKSIAINYYLNGQVPVSLTLDVQVMEVMLIALKFTPRVGTLYLLRDRHPVIDAIGVLKSDGFVYLILLQLSLQEYSKHESKSQDIFKFIKSPEKVTL